MSAPTALRSVALTCLLILTGGGCTDPGPSPSDAGMDGGIPPTPAIVISSGGDTSWETEPTVAVAPDGTLAVAWLGISGFSNAQPGYAFSHDRGQTWSAPARAVLPDGRMASNEIVVADQAGAFYLVSLGVSYSAGESRVYVAKAAPGQGSFGPWVEVSDPATALLRDASSIVVAADQSLVVSWAEYTPARKVAIMTARSTDGGSTWTRTAVTEPQPRTAWPNLCASRTDGRVAVVYVDAGNGGTAVRVSEDHGATWPQENQNMVYLTENYGEFPSCVLSDADLWIFQGQTMDQPTTDLEPTLDLVEMTHSGDGGKTLDPTVAVHDTGAGPKYMKAMAVLDDQARLSLVYYAGAMDEDPQATLRHAVSTDGNKTFGATEPLFSPVLLTTSRSSNAWLGDLLGIAADGQNTFVTFVENGAGKSHVGYTRLTP